MTRAAGSLWSADIKPDILSPKHILTLQASLLGEQTKGVLVGELSERKANDSRVFTLEMFAPAINYRHQVLTASHSLNRLYPVHLDADVFRSTRMLADIIQGKKHTSRADSDDELVKLIEKVLTSSEVVSLAQSLIALSNEAANGPTNFVLHLKDLAESDRQSAIDEKIEATYYQILDSEAAASAIAETNAGGWGVDNYQIQDIDLRGEECIVKLSYSASGEQDMEKPSSGDTITGTAEAVIDSRGTVDYREITASVEEDFIDPDTGVQS
jgi:hypothetical protein